MQPRRPRDGVRADLRGRGARRHRRLPRLAAGDPPATALAPPDMAAERRHVRAHRGKVGLVLHPHGASDHGVAAVRTRGRGEDVDDDIDVGGGVDRRGP